MAAYNKIPERPSSASGEKSGSALIKGRGCQQDGCHKPWLPTTVSSIRGGATPYHLINTTEDLEGNLEPSNSIFSGVSQTGSRDAAENPTAVQTRPPMEVDDLDDAFGHRQVREVRKLEDEGWDSLWDTDEGEEDENDDEDDFTFYTRRQQVSQYDNSSLGSNSDLEVRIIPGKSQDGTDWNDVYFRRKKGIYTIPLDVDLTAAPVSRVYTGQAVRPKNEVKVGIPRKGSAGNSECCAKRSLGGDHAKNLQSQCTSNSSTEPRVHIGSLYSENIPYQSMEYMCDDDDLTDLRQGHRLIMDSKDLHRHCRMDGCIRTTNGMTSDSSETHRLVSSQTYLERGKCSVGQSKFVDRLAHATEHLIRWLKNKMCIH